jgi:hypothetical protein
VPALTEQRPRPDEGAPREAHQPSSTLSVSENSSRPLPSLESNGLRALTRLGLAEEGRSCA